MKKNFYTPNDPDAVSDSDSASIQNAIRLAEKCGCNHVVIPRYNERTDTYAWEIDESILLPDNITVTLDGCYMFMKEGTYCNMFRNEKSYTNEGKTLGGEQKNIRLFGMNGATLDGGVYNGYSEYNTKDGTLINNCLILFSNVRDFKIEGITLQNQRYWSMAFYFCCYGEIRNLNIYADFASKDKEGNRIDRIPEVYENVYIINGDGIDIRTGCNNILIENISGRTQDDSVACTALKGKGEMIHAVEGKNFDIHDIIIKNIRTSVHLWAAQVRLLNSDGCLLHDICIDTVYDTTDTTLPYRNGSAILIGDKEGFYGKVPQKKGETYNISVSNVFSAGVAAVRLCNHLQNVIISNVFTKTDTNYALLCPYEGNFSNVMVCDIFVADDSDIDSVVAFGKDVKGEILLDGIHANDVSYVVRNSGGIDVKLESLCVNEIEKAVMIEEYSWLPLFEKKGLRRVKR